MSNHNKIVKLFENIKIKGKDEQSPDRVESKLKKKIYQKPPSNWSAWKIVEFIKDNPEYMDNEYFEEPILNDGLYMAGKYASEIKTKRWPKFESVYLFEEKKERVDIFSYDFVERYIFKFFNSSERSNELEILIDRSLSKFKSKLNLAKKSDQFLFNIASDKVSEKIITAIKKAALYGKASGLEQMQNQAKDLFLSFWELIVSKLVELPATQADGDTCAPSSGESSQPFSVTKLYHRLVNLNNCEMPFLLESTTNEWTDRLTDLFVNAIKASTRFDDDSELKPFKKCHRIFNQTSYVLKNLEVFPEKLQKALEDQPYFWFEYVSLCLVQKKTVNEEMLDKLSSMYCKAIKQVVAGENNYSARTVYECVKDFFEYLAKSKRRSDKIEEVLLSLDSLNMAKEYVNAFQ